MPVGTDIDKNSGEKVQQNLDEKNKVSNDSAGKIKLTQMKKPHRSIDTQLMKIHQALYCGGEEFRDILETVLYKRSIESLNGKFRDERKALARYINRIGGLIHWMLASAFEKDPQIIVKKGSQNLKDFYESFNSDADGLGTPFYLLLRNALESCLLHNRAAFVLSFDDDLFEPSADKKPRALARVANASEFDDWDKNGREYTWTRLSNVKEIRENFYSQDVKRQFTFQYLYKDKIDVYSAFSGDEFVTFEKSETHDFGEMPVFPIDCNESLWVMNKLRDPALGLFNREVSLTYALDKMAYAILALNLVGSEEIKSLVDATTGALLFRDAASKASYLHLPADAFEPLFRDRKDSKEALYECMHALAITALAVQSQNARQSASAKELDTKPINNLLRSLTKPILTSAQKMIWGINRFLGEEDAVVVIENAEPKDDVEDLPGMDDE